MNDIVDAVHMTSDGMNIDIVMCIDCTASMGPIINELKESSRSVYDMIVAHRGDADIGRVRIRVIGFRDLTDGDDLQESGFFTLPEDNEGFADFIDGIEAEGGGDGPETGLDTIAEAMSSEWCTDGAKRRQIILMLTDATTKPPGEQTLRSELPDSMDGWNERYIRMMHYANKRMVIYSPNDRTWTEPLKELYGTKHVPVQIDAGMYDLTVDDIIRTVMEHSL